MWSLVVSVLVMLVTPCCGHVGLYYPPARKYALDFLDSVRTQPPCGMAGLLLRRIYLSVCLSVCLPIGYYIHIVTVECCRAWSLCMSAESHELKKQFQVVR